MPKSTNVFYTMKSAPPRIKFSEGDEVCRVKYDPVSKTSVRWEPNGVIVITYDNGTVETYHPKPTIQEVVGSRYRERGEYYRIHINGSVEHSFGGVCYYWGPEEEVEWDMSGIMPDIPEEETPDMDCYCAYCCGLISEPDYGYEWENSREYRSQYKRKSSW